MASLTIVLSSWDTDIGVTGIRIGLVGAGFMSATHLARYTAMDDVRVVAVYSPTTAPEFVAEHDLDATAYTDPEAFFGHEMDAVDVCSPTGTHATHAMTAARQGLAVFCEKPLALSLEEAYEVRDAVREANVPFMAGHVVRFFHAYEAARQEVADGAVGEVASVRARRRSPPPDWADWYADDARTGGVFHDLGIHEFDYLRATVGEIERVFARRRRWDTKQHGHAVVRFANGARGHVEAGWDLPPGVGLQSDLEIAGTDGVIELGEEGSGLTVTAPDGIQTGTAVERDGYRRELDAFCEAVNGGSVPVDIDDAIASMRVSLAATRSAERGEPVVVEEVGP